MKKEPEHICRTCRLFNREKRECNVTFLHEGEKIRIPVQPDDKCFFEQDIVAKDSNGNVDKFKLEIESVGFWIEDKEGNKVDGNGIVKIEFPKSMGDRPGFYGHLR